MNYNLISCASRTFGIKVVIICERLLNITQKPPLPLAHPTPDADYQ